MRRPRLSTGAWIFCGLICAALIAPAGVYAASITKVSLVSGSTAAGITPQHQVLTAPIAPSRVVRAVKVVSSGCQTAYTPPAGKAIVVTSVTYNFGSGTNGVENFGGLFNAGCGVIYDQIDTVQAYETLQHTWPLGLPMPSVALTSSGSGPVAAFIYGYLVDAKSLPARSASHAGAGAKAFVPSR